MNSESFVLQHKTKEAGESLLNKSFAHTGISSYRWTFMLICNLGQFSYNWVAAMFGSLQTPIMRDVGIKNYQYGAILSATQTGSWIMPLVMGLLIDRFGARLGYIYGNTVVTLGFIVLAFAGQYENYNGLIFGSVIISFGIDAINLGRYKLICKWFKGKDLGLALAIGSSLHSISGLACGYITPALYESSGSLGFTIFFGALMGIISYLFAYISCEMDNKRENELNTFINTDEFTETIKLEDFKKLTLLFWLFCIPFLFTQCIISPITSFNSEALQQRFNFDEKLAGLFGQFLFISSILFGPLIGILIDKVGRLAEIMTFSVILAILSCISFAILPDCDQCYTPLLPILLQGFAGTFSAVGMMTGIAKLLDSNMVGSTFGFVMWFYGVLSYGFPIFDGKIIDSTEDIKHGYFWVYLINAVILLLGVIGGIAAVVVDYKTGKKLGLPSKPETLEEEERIIEENRSTLLSTPIISQ